MAEKHRSSIFISTNTVIQEIEWNINSQKKQKQAF
ncbi:hypothetical protein PRUB_a6001 [Pseudoalteromonas rubra]|uniref:Uncharacterized protein n=1 Tax=Pseudoalteromonas rubra TaxID=43658 RepID=A0A8T0CEV3_9GAMM|nr:hypothetical protein PRUB_a6001 [Pseudoalteromonas rubra]